MQNLTCQNKARVNIQFGEAMNIAHLLLVIQFTNSPNVVFNLNNVQEHFDKLSMTSVTL